MSVYSHKYYINKFCIAVISTDNNEFVDIMLTENKDGWYKYDFYIHLHKDPRFPIDYSVPPKALKSDEKLSDESAEEKHYRIEYAFYMHRKDQGQPMWRIHKTTLDRIIRICKEIG